MQGLPPGQDVIQSDDLLAWTNGPLPDSQLEQIAWLLFRFRYPNVTFDNTFMTAERDECRRLALQLRARFLRRDRWHAANAAEQLAMQTAAVVFGDRQLGPTLRKEIADYAQAYISDLWITFRDRLLLRRDVEANQRELEQERQTS